MIKTVHNVDRTFRNASRAIIMKGKYIVSFTKKQRNNNIGATDRNPTVNAWGRVWIYLVAMKRNASANPTKIR